jgi:hypothetical protein
MKLRIPLVVGLVVGLAAAVPSAHAAKGVKKKGDHWVNGTVLHVDHKGQHEGEITVKVHHHKKKSQGATGQGHKLAVHQGTRFVTRQGDKERAASFAAVKNGEHVSVEVKSHRAEMVVIHHHHHKKTVSAPAANPLAAQAAAKKIGKK